MKRVELESLALIPWVSIPLLPSKMRTATVAQSTDLFLAGRFAHAWAFRGTSSLSHSALHSGCLKPVSLSWFFLRSTSPVIASVSGTCVYNKLPHSVVVQFAVTKARLARNIDIYFDSYSAPEKLEVLIAWPIVWITIKQCGWHNLSPWILFSSWSYNPKFHSLWATTANSAIPLRIQLPI